MRYVLWLALIGAGCCGCSATASVSVNHGPVSANVAVY